MNYILSSDETCETRISIDFNDLVPGKYGRILQSELLLSVVPVTHESTSYFQFAQPLFALALSAISRARSTERGFNSNRKGLGMVLEPSV